MATREAKLKIEVDGEKEYKERIAEINRENRTLGEQLKKLAAEYKGNENSIEALTKKQTLLDRQLLEQRAKVEDTRKQLESWRAALERARQEQGATSDAYKTAQKKVQEYEAALAKAETQEINVRRSLEETTRSLSENQQALSKYDKEIDSLQKNEKLLDAQLRTLSAEYKGNTDSVEFLTKQTSLYENQLESTKAEIESLQAALKVATEEYGENSAEVNELQLRLEDATSRMYDQQHALEETSQALKNHGKVTFTVGDAVDKLASKVGVHLPKELTKGLNSSMSFSTGTVAAFGAVTAAATVLYKIVSQVVTKLNEMTLQAAGKADDLLTRSITSGLSTTDLQALEYAAPYTDVDTSTLEGAFSRMPKVIRQAQEQMEAYQKAQEQAAATGKAMTAELGAQAAAFEALGISMTDGAGNLRDYHDVVWDALEALGQMGDTTEAAALANDLFGKSYADLKPLMQNAEEAQRLMNEAVEQGYVLSEEQLQILAEVDDEHQHLTQTQEKYSNMIATQWAPVNKAAYETLADLMTMAGDALIDSNLIGNTATLISNTLQLVDGAAQLLQKFPVIKGWITVMNKEIEGMNRILEATKNILGIKAEQKGYGGIGSDIAGAEWKEDVQAWVSRSGVIIDSSNVDLFDKTTGKLTGSSFGGVPTTFYSGPTEPVYSYGHMSEEEIQRLIGRNAAGNDNWRGGLTYLNEAGPEAVFLPNGTRILNAQDTRALGGSTTYNINVANVQELQQLLDLMDGLRVRRRMA